MPEIVLLRHLACQWHRVFFDRASNKIHNLRLVPKQSRKATTAECHFNWVNTKVWYRNHILGKSSRGEKVLIRWQIWQTILLNRWCKYLKVSSSKKSRMTSASHKRLSLKRRMKTWSSEESLNYYHSEL